MTALPASPSVSAEERADRAPVLPGRAASAISWLYGATVFVSAALLFVVEPMAAKAILPRFGGTPSVWNTCMVFFQVVLLLGYLYVHSSTLLLRARSQASVHVALLGAAMLGLPLVLGGPGNPALAGRPTADLLLLLVTGAGAPFFVLSATAPLLQRWLASIRHPSAGDPYFLYAASNAGSFGSLLAYPILIEPWLTLSNQVLLWKVGYAVLGALLTVCGGVVWARGHGGAMERSTRQRAARPLAIQRLRWLALAFIPSSLTLGVTTHLTTDVASVPLLWVAPLAVYLLTFVLAFGGRQVIGARTLGRVLPWVLLALLASVFLGVPRQVWLSVPCHLVGLFAIGLLCHTTVADERPEPAALTEFYLWLSLGGALGGVFNALVAPAVFSTVFEYPLVLAAAAFAQPSATWPKRPVPALLGLPLAVAAIGGALVAAMRPFAALPDPRVFADVAMVLLVVWFGFSGRPLAFGVVTSLAVVALTGMPRLASATLLAERSFFGVYRVTSTEKGRFHVLSHGTTMHGTEDRTAPACEPLSYYSRQGPAGQAFSALERTAAPRRVAAVGLGTGSLACYARTGERWTFFEIDPLIQDIARTEGYFTFLGRAKGRIDVVLGDGRLSLGREQGAPFDLIVLDAFSSDAIPVHLMTAEAMSLYLSHLAPGGVLLFNISNRHLDLAPAVSCLAGAANLAGVVQYDGSVGPKALADGVVPSQWVALGRAPGAIDAVRSSGRWQPLPPARGSCWTDEFSNIFGAIRWPSNSH